MTINKRISNKQMATANEKQWKPKQSSNNKHTDYTQQTKTSNKKETTLKKQWSCKYTSNKKQKVTYLYCYYYLTIYFIVITHICTRVVFVYYYLFQYRNAFTCASKYGHVFPNLLFSHGADVSLVQILG